MKKRFLALLFVVTSLYAEPVIPAGAIQAVQQNPALLNTPQAQALMSEHGVTPAEVMQKIEGSQSNQAQESSIQVEQAQNTVDEETTPAEASTQTGGIKDDTNRFLNHKNPFAYRENTTIEKNLEAKQQYLDTNKLSRYAARFYANKNSFDAASMPTPEDYVVTIGDIFSVQIYGDRNQEYTLELRNDGSAIIPYIGPISLGGMSYKEAKAQIQKTLQTHFKQSSFNIRLSKYSTMQVTLVGETKAPGLYNLSSFSTIKELLLASNGINANTSVRDIVIKRGGKIIAHVDFYELLFGGVDASSTILKHGDIVILSNAKKLVSIDGLVNNAAIFELKDGENLDKLIAYASGMKPNASKMNIKVKRFESNSQVSTYNVSITEAPSFALQNGDSVYIYPLDFSAQKSVNLYGNIIRPGSYSLPTDMQLSTLLKENVKDSLKSFFLPQTHFEYGVIKRYDDTLNFKTLSFNLASVLNAKEQVTLQPQDEIYFFNQNDIYTNAYIMTKGKVLIKPGKLQYFNGMSVQDAINASGVNGFLHNIVRVTTYYTDDWMPKSRFVESNELNSTLLNPYDEVEVYSYYDVNTLKPISIQGEVINPLKTYYEDKMTLADLVNFAGGLTDKAYNKKIEIVRYSLNTDLVREREIITIELKDKKFDDIILQPYDEVTIFRIPKWSEKMTITLKGQVMFP
ncbi:MAG: SLBB domain-containing protein, partial [Epsilonproteobacteria bacterium]|nr:SLBB domain-containing protein [Campylobacterota bacterium]